MHLEFYQPIFFLPCGWIQNRELLSPEGFRIDGRRPNELRKIRCKIGVFAKADGSSYFEQGNTKVLATVFGPREVH